MSTLQERFQQAQVAVKALHQAPDVPTLLELYALYKQGTEGDVRGSRPGMLDPKARAKFDAWAQRKGQSTAAAQEAYVALVERLQS